MRRGVKNGFTIVESMIVLAVTGVLFISLVGLVTGQQNKAQFKNSMTEITADIQSTIGQVSNGYYPAANTTFGCVAHNGNPRVTTSIAGGGTGANGDCTFLGQAMMFGTGFSGDTQEYKVQTLVGLRLTTVDGTPREPLNLGEANVRVMAPGSSDPVTQFLDRQLTANSFVAKGKFAVIENPPEPEPPTTPPGPSTGPNPDPTPTPLPNPSDTTPPPDTDGDGVPDSTDQCPSQHQGTSPDSAKPGCPQLPVGAMPDLSFTKTLQFGTTLQWMRIDNGTNNGAPIAGFAIVTAPNGQLGASGSVESGVVLPSIIPIPCYATIPNCNGKGVTPKNGVDAIVRALDTDGATAAPKGVRLCFLSATTNQSALVKIGENGSNNSIEMTIHNNEDCA